VGGTVGGWPLTIGCPREFFVAWSAFRMISPEIRFDALGARSGKTAKRCRH
jgi:hypothetical protein